MMKQRSLWRHWGVAVALLAGLTPASSAAQTSETDCTFQFGFRAIRNHIPQIVGQCLDNEGFNPDNGNAEQRTLSADGKLGLMVWRKADNWTAFTDGHRTWLMGPNGLQDRLNAGARFDWEQELTNTNTNANANENTNTLSSANTNTNSAAGGQATGGTANAQGGNSTNTNQNVVSPNITINNVITVPSGASQAPVIPTVAAIPTLAPVATAPASVAAQAGPQIAPSPTASAAQQGTRLSVMSQIVEGDEWPGNSARITGELRNDGPGTVYGYTLVAVFSDRWGDEINRMRAGRDVLILPGTAVGYEIRGHFATGNIPEYQTLKIEVEEVRTTPSGNVHVLPVSGLKVTVAESRGDLPPYTNRTGVRPEVTGTVVNTIQRPLQSVAVAYWVLDERGQVIQAGTTSGPLRLRPGEPYAFRSGAYASYIWPSLARAKTVKAIAWGVEA